jgi:Protein of unknown function (DUF4236)
VGFYIRKSLRVGPVRFNLSKSGIGTSIGVTGFRVGSGPRGSYVHMGRDGLYYRKSFGGGRPRSPSPPTAASPDPGPLTVYDSGSIDELADEDSEALVDEINRRAARIPWQSMLLGLAAALFAVLACGALSAVGHGGVAPADQVAGYGGVALGLASLALFPFAVLRDVGARSTALMFDLEGPAADAYRALYEAVLALGGCDALWQVAGTRPGANDKYDLGASHRVLRTLVRPRAVQPPHVRTNVSVAMLPAGRQHLYFLPDRLLVLEGARYAAIAWAHLQAVDGTIRLVEDGAVPPDATRAGTSWLHPNKDGGPDLRFKVNPQIPVVEYGTLRLRSATGLDELFYASRADRTRDAARAIEAISGVATA